MVVTATSNDPNVLCLVPQDAARRPCPEPPAATHQLKLDLPPVEIGIPHGLPEAGSRTGQLKIVDEQLASNRLTITMEAPAGSFYQLPVRINRPGLRLDTTGNTLQVRFRPGSGYQREVINLKW